MVGESGVAFFYYYLFIRKSYLVPLKLQTPSIRGIGNGRPILYHKAGPPNSPATMNKVSLNKVLEFFK